MTPQVRQIAVVTGAAGGFGMAISRQLIEVGYAVAATDVDAEALDQLIQRMGSPSALHTFVMDVTDYRAVERTAGEITAALGSNITLLVNNAGIIGRSFCLSEKGFSEAHNVIDVNLSGAFHCTSIFSKFMAKLKYGRIINIASVAGIWGAAGGSAYAASKAGLIKASESWARELGPLNISVTAIAPGICKTNMLSNFLEKDVAVSASSDDAGFVKGIVPVGRWGTPEDVAEVVTFLATCKTNYLNSAVIAMDGGMRVGSL